MYIQLKAKTTSNENYLTNGRLRNICRRTRKNRDMLRVGTIITITLVLVYSTLASSYAFAAGPDPQHTVLKVAHALVLMTLRD